MEGRTRKKNKSDSLYIRSSPSGLPPKLEVPGPLACHSCPLMSLAQIGPPFPMSRLVRPGDYCDCVGAEGAQSSELDPSPREEERKRGREGGRGGRPDTWGDRIARGKGHGQWSGSQLLRRLVGWSPGWEDGGSRGGETRREGRCQGSMESPSHRGPRLRFDMILHEAQARGYEHTGATKLQGRTKAVRGYLSGT